MNNKESRQSQNEKVLAYLKTGKGLSVKEASAELFIHYFSGRIRDLRNSGWLIEMRKRNGETRGTYFLVGKTKNIAS